MGLSEAEVLDLLRGKFEEEVTAFHDYSASSLVDAFWLGYYRYAVEFIRASAES